MKAILFANTDWYLYNFRLEFAKFLQAKGWEVLFLSPNGEYAERIRQEGFRHIPLEFSRKGVNPFAEVKTIEKIKRVYREESPDLVHHFTIKCVIYGSIAAKSLRVRSIINSITGLGYVFLSDKPQAMLLRTPVKFFYQKALRGTQVLFENPDDRSLFDSMNISPKDSSHVVLGTGINTDIFAPIPAPDSIPLVTLPARMIWDKGIGEFVQAAAAIHGKGIQARFALIGKNDDGNPSSIPYQQLTYWQKEGDVEWWGWQEDMRTVISLSDIVCLPSYREGLPKVLIEAASCARPIVTTDVPGCHEVVEDGINGFVVPAKDSKALETALVKLIQDSDLRKRMGKASRERAVSLFSNDRVNSGIYRVYQIAMGNPWSEI